MQDQNLIDQSSDSNNSHSTSTATLRENRPGRSRKSKLPQIIGLAAAGILIILTISLVIMNSVLDGQYQGKIDPAISISGVYVGEMTRDEARDALQKQLQAYTASPVVLSFQGTNWQPSLEQLGVSVNIDGAVDKALSLSKRGDFIKDSRIYKLVSPEAQNLPLEVVINESKLKGYLSDISDRIRKDAIEPDVQIKGTDIVATEGKNGFNLNYDLTYDNIKKSLATLKPNTQNLMEVGDVTPVISTQEFNDFKVKITAIVGSPVSVKFKDKNWTLDSKQLASMIKISRSTKPSDPQHFSFTFDKKPVDTFVNGLKTSINQDPKDATLGWDNGKVTAKVPSQDGQQLVVDRSIEEISKVILDPSTPNRSVDLVVDVKEPTLSSNNLDKLGIKEVIGEGISSFNGSAYERSTNIKVGASFLTGKFIKPHSVFSFLDSIGEISLARGYVKGYAIVADQTVPDVGGGICQVSTTTFRAAFYAGLPIVERNAHAYRVSWYEEMGEPVGFDAAVYQPGVDMKFENNTDNWMYLEAQVTNGKLYVRLYGTKIPGQTVEMVPGKIYNVTNPPPDRIEIDKSLKPGQKSQVDYARKGLSTDIYRVIKMNGVEVQRDDFATKFAAWPNIIKIGPTPTAAPSPSPNPNGTPAPGGSPAPSNQPPASTTPAPAPTTTKP